MLLDKTLLLSENQAVTVTAFSQNVISFQDMGRVYGDQADLKRNFGAGEPLPLLVQVTQAFAGATSVTFEILTSDSETLTSPTVVAASAAIPVASLGVGYRPEPHYMPDVVLKKYLGMRYTVAGTAATAGKVTAAVATERDSTWL